MLWKQWLKLLKPPPRLKISDWARANRVLSRKDSAAPGRWRSDPHQDAIMDAFCDPQVWKVVVMSASQIVGKSQMMMNVVGYYIDVDPTNTMMVFPTVQAAENWSKGRLDLLIETTKSLQGKIRLRQARDSENTIFHRQFRGGQMFIVGSNSPTGLSAQSVRIMIADEVDRYEASAEGEGDPLELAEQRTETYWNRKIAHVSTPLISGSSRIEASYEESDKRIYECYCPHCREFTQIEFAHVQWDKDETKAGRARHLTDTARVICEHCGAEWNEIDRQRAIKAGRWRATAPFRGIAGFRINAFACARASLPRIAERWVRAKGKPEREKAFVNLVEARAYVERGDAPEAERLHERREQYRRGIVPAGGLILTVGADKQKDRLEAEIVAWGRELESWSVDYRVFHGDTAQPEVWAQLAALLNEPFEHADGGTLRIARMAVDAGDEANLVYAWRRQLGDNRVILIKGFDHIQAPLGRPSWMEINTRGMKIKRGVQLWPVGSSYLKTELYSWLRLPMAEGPNPRFCHFPGDYDREFFDQLTAEQLITRVVKGYPRREWTKTRSRNEALDCRLYSRAAAAQMGLDRWSERRWAEIEAMQAMAVQAEERGDPDPEPAKRERRPAKPSWIDDRGRGGDWFR